MKLGVFFWGGGEASTSQIPQIEPCHACDFEDTSNKPINVCSGTNVSLFLSV